MESTVDAIRAAIAQHIGDAQAIDVSGQGGHFNIAVTSPSFAGKNTLERHRMVLTAIKHLMAGDQAPVHAVDSIKTST
jgi:stress-induced morphogen